VRAGILSRANWKPPSPSPEFASSRMARIPAENGKYAISLSPARFEAGYRESGTRPAGGPELHRRGAQKRDRALGPGRAGRRRHPSIAQAGRDWMSCPDLKKLYDDYIRDPTRRLRARLAQSKNFAALAGRYAATRPSGPWSRHGSDRRPRSSPRPPWALSGRTVPSRASSPIPPKPWGFAAKPERA